MNDLNVAQFIRELENTDVFHCEAAKFNFALEIKNAMEREGINNTELAERLGVSKPMISKLLRGDSNLTIETMVKACRSVGSRLYIKVLREGTTERLVEIAKSAREKSHAHAGIYNLNAHRSADYFQVWRGNGLPANDCKYEDQSIPA